MLRTLLLFGTAVVVACGYSPPPHTNTATPRYKTDLAACNTSVPDAVDARNAKTGLRWMASGVTRWTEIDTGIDACMADKGWGRTRACTPEELRTGGGNRTVTTRGIECADAGKAG